MSHINKSTEKWTTQDFMSFVLSLGIKGKVYEQIKKEMADGYQANDIATCTPIDIKDALHINMIMAKKIQKGLVQLTVKESMPNAPSNSSTSNHASMFGRNGFSVHLRGAEGKRTTLRKSFTIKSTIAEVARSYKEQESVAMSYKVEEIRFVAKSQELHHDKTLGEYGIVDEKNLLCVIFRAKGGSDDYKYRAVEEWNMDDLISWIPTMTFAVVDEDRIIQNINDNSLTGGDLKDDDNTISEIADLLQITPVDAQRLYHNLQNWKPSIRVAPPVSYSNHESNGARSLELQFHHFYVGYKLDCKDCSGRWCPAQVLAVNKDSINVKYLHWRSGGKTKSGYQEDTFDRSDIGTHCRRYGQITNTSNKNANVHRKKRSVHPTKEYAARIRAEQKQTTSMGKSNKQSNVNGMMANVGNWICGRSNVNGMIGLENEGNQCYMISAIQLVVNTPPLLRLFRGNYNARHGSLLYQLMDLCEKAQSPQTVYSPHEIKSILALEDYASFGDHSQQDAGHAFSILLEILDRELLRCRYGGGRLNYNEHNAIQKMMNEYNPDNQSVIRDLMTFILCETYECMTQNCDYKETRYRHVRKLVLPLKNHSLRVPVTIYSAATSGSRKREFTCVSYCGLNTLIAQIHQELRNIKDSNYDIDLYCIETKHRDGSNKAMDPCQILQPVPLNQTCAYLLGKSVYAIAKPLETDTDGDGAMEEDVKENDATMLMRQFYICVNNKGKVKGLKFNLVKATITEPVKRLPLIICKGPISYYYHIYYRSRILSLNDTCTVQSSCNAMVIVYTETRNKKSMGFVADGYATLACKGFELSDPAFRIHQLVDYAQVRESLTKMRINTNTSALKDADADYTTHDEAMRDAIETYSGMAKNQSLVSTYLSHALQLGCQRKCSRKHPQPLSSLSECLETYLETQVLDSGASVSCTKCKRCEVFKTSTSIVRHPQICTILFDRFNHGRNSKHDHKVSFKKELELDTQSNHLKANYDLYAVSNHRSSVLEFGHYYTYVQCMDKNNSVWYVADDSRISPINERKVTDNKNALVLMYEKKATRNI
eukprot:374159_1